MPGDGCRGLDSRLPCILQDSARDSLHVWAELCWALYSSSARLLLSPSRWVQPRFCPSVTRLSLLHTRASGVREEPEAFTLPPSLPYPPNWFLQKIYFSESSKQSSLKTNWRPQTSHCMGLEMCIGCMTSRSGCPRDAPAGGTACFSPRSRPRRAHLQPAGLCLGCWALSQYEGEQGLPQRTRCGNGCCHILCYRGNISG